MQEDIDTWEGHLKTTCGETRSDKSFVCPIGFVFANNGTFKFEEASNIKDIMSVCDHLNERETLELVEDSEGQDTLGAALAPHGNMNNECKLLNKKIHK